MNQTEEEILFGHKASLEIILGLIKKFQVDYLVNGKGEIKNILKSIKKSLTELEEEKNKKIEFLLNQYNQKKSSVQNMIFKPVYSKRSVSSTQFLNQNLETLVTEGNDVYNKETSELKLLNFNAENEVIKLNNAFQRDTILLYYYKSPRFFFEKCVEIDCKNKKSIDLITRILHQVLLQKRKKFVSIANLKSMQNTAINDTQNQQMVFQNAIKDKQKSHKYIETQQVIQEENKSYAETKLEDGNKSPNSSAIKDFQHLKLLDINEVEKLLRLNMNINVNINYNNQYINNKFCTKKKSDIKEEDSLDHCKNEKVQEDTLK